VGHTAHFTLLHDEIGGVRVTLLTVKISADLFSFFPHVQPANDRKTDLVLFQNFLGVLLLIDRQGDSADTRLFELFAVSNKV
jgi:hypothetical protein